MTDLVQLRRSPYIDRPIDNTALEAFTQCDWKFFASMILHRRREGRSTALDAGSAWHKMMELHYKTGGDRDIVLAGLAAIYPGPESPDDHRTPERLRLVYDQYLRKWGDHETDSRNNGRTVGFPNQPLVEIPIEIGWEIHDSRTGEEISAGRSLLESLTSYEASLHPYTGKIDRIIEWQGLYYVEDHKTTTQPGGDGVDRFGAAFFDQFNPSNQMMGYAWLAQKLTGLPIAGIRINGIGWQKSQTKFARQIISYAPPRLTEWANNYNRLLERLELGYRRLQEGVPDDVAFPRTWRCSQKYGKCQYSDVCATVRNRRMQVLEQDFIQKAWDPMEITGEEEAV